MPDGRNLVQKGIYCQPSPTFKGLYDLPIQARGGEEEEEEEAESNPHRSITSIVAVAASPIVLLLLVSGL